jgi:hypothetical protein
VQRLDALPDALLDEATVLELREEREEIVDIGARGAAFNGSLTDLLTRTAEEARAINCGNRPRRCPRLRRMLDINPEMSRLVDEANKK